jgi:MYXO-CTERM domain-containing protein
VLEAQLGAGAAFFFEARDAGAVGRNPAQGLVVELDGGAVQIRSRHVSQGWQLGLQYVALGRAGKERPVGAVSGSLEIDRNAALWRYANGSDQWLVNGPLGVEQGFVLHREPDGAAGGEELRLSLEVTGGLAPVLGPGGAYVSLRSSQGRPLLRYSDLFAYDADGVELSSRLEVEGETIALVVDDSSARYPVTIDPLIWTEVGKLVASDGLDLDWLGRSVAVSGETAVVGAWRDSGDPAGLGVAYVYDRVATDPESWQEVAKLTPTDSEEGDDFGYAVGISGDTAVVGAYREDGAGEDRGAVYLFQRDAGGSDSWGQVAKVPGSDSVDFDIFGWSVAIDGSTVAVGAYRNANGGTGRGAVYLYEPDAGGTWGEVAKLGAADLADQDRFGSAVAVHADTVLVGSMFADAGGTDRGAAYVFGRNVDGPGAWGEVAKLSATAAADGDGLGGAVAMSADTAIAGAQYADAAGSDRGVVYVFERDAGGADSWGQVATATASDGADGDWLCGDVSLSGDRAVAGARYHGSNDSDRGAVYAFERDAGGPDSWGEVAKRTASDGADGDFFGWAVAVDGDVLVVGAPRQDLGGINRGAAYVFGLRKGLGDPCAMANECASGFCIDGVCCDSACADGDSLDCYGCSQAVGAPHDGFCFDLVGTVCDDGLFCTVVDRCSAGTCVGDGSPCAGVDGDADCSESCDEEAEACTAPDPDGSTCPDGVCLAGACEPLGTGGAAGAGGAAGEGGAPGTPRTGPIIVHGCGCRVGAQPSQQLPPWLVLLAASGWGWRRRRAQPLSSSK